MTQAKHLRRVIPVEYTRDERELLRAYRDLPRCERSAFLAAIGGRAMLWRMEGIDLPPTKVTVRCERMEA